MGVVGVGVGAVGPGTHMLAVPRRLHSQGVFMGDYEAEDLVEWWWTQRAPGHWTTRVTNVVRIRGGNLVA